MGYCKTFGVVPSPYDIRDYTLNVAMAGNYPEEFKLEPPTVLNQGSVGACVAHSLAEIAQYHNIKQNGIDKKMSTMCIYGNRRSSSYKKVGMVPRDALNDICKAGVCYQDEMPGNVEVPDAIDIFENSYNKDLAYPHRFSEFFRLKTANDIKHALMNYGPVAFTVTWYDDMKYKNGILDSENRKEASGAHCMIIYGWNSDGWLIQNSWGSSWGSRGHAILPFNFPINEAWGITDDIVESDEIVKPYRSAFGQFIAKIINAIVRFFTRR